jgi:hypothetical protein
VITLQLCAICEEISCACTDIDFPEDCERILAIAARRGLKMTMGEADDLWRRYSDEYFSAGWMMMDRDPTRGDAEIDRVLDWHQGTRKHPNPDPPNYVPEL